MQLQRSHVSIVRSIRQVSLARDWIRARGSQGLPNISSFEVNERAGDALDLALFRVTVDVDGAAFVCLRAGDRVRAIHGAPMVDCPLADCLVPSMADAVMPVWNACVVARLPVYSIIPVNDADGRPVTLEQILLPYSDGGTEPGLIVSSLHAWSTEGRFVIEWLLRIQEGMPPLWSVLLDPDARQVAKDPRTAIGPAPDDGLDG